MPQWTLRDILSALKWNVDHYARASRQPWCTARGQVYEGRIPEYPKPAAIKKRLSEANRIAGCPVPREAIRSLWTKRGAQ